MIVSYKCHVSKEVSEDINLCVGWQLAQFFNEFFGGHTIPFKKGRPCINPDRAVLNNSLTGLVSVYLYPAYAAQVWA